MRYTEFRDSVRAALRDGGSQTYRELQARADLPYERPCPAWVAQLEQEIGLQRTTCSSSGRAQVWSLSPKKAQRKPVARKRKPSSSTLGVRGGPRKRRQREPQPRLSSGHAGDFSLPLFRGAIDAERVRRQLTWVAAVRQINRQDDGCVWKHPIAVSSVSKVGQNRSGVAEGDGVLQMLVWLRRSPESFVLPKVEGADSATRYRLPVPVRDQILRWNTVALHAALDEKRAATGSSWADVAAAIGDCNVGTLSRLARGGRVSFPHVMRLVRWTDRPATEFTTFMQHPTEV